MTHSPSSTVADRPPAMYRSATTAIVVSSTSMKVGTTTTAAITQGFAPARDPEGARTASVIFRRPPGSPPNSMPVIAAQRLVETSRHRARSAVS
jgi:hypothetical protein